MTMPHKNFLSYTVGNPQILNLAVTFIVNSGIYVDD